jgi:hypothetical protein
VRLVVPVLVSVLVLVRQVGWPLRRVPLLLAGIRAPVALAGSTPRSSAECLEAHLKAGSLSVSLLVAQQPTVQRRARPKVRRLDGHR